MIASAREYGLATRTSSAIIICTVGSPDLLDCVESLCRQTRAPDLVNIVVGGAARPQVDQAAARLAQTGIIARVVTCEPGLIRQRNLLLPELRQDVVYFIDDDAVLAPDYLERTMRVYDDDQERRIGGVQGVLAEHAYVWPLGLSRIFRRLFLLSETTGDGRLKASGHPSFSASVSHVTDVEVMLGCAMSFRREALGEGFDRALDERWWGDDFIMAYAVSRRYRVVQVPGAVFWHEPAHGRPDKDYDVMRMQVINRWYVYRRYQGGRLYGIGPFLWASVGELLQGLVYLARGRTGLLRGFFAGWRSLTLRRG